MAGTMAFYNGMMPGITEMVKSLSGDEAARRGYAKAATAEHDIASARKANIESQIKQSEYGDIDKNATSYVLGQHGISAPDFQAYQRHKMGSLSPGEQPRTYSPDESAKFDAALRDYGALKTGKFHDVSQGATGFAQLPAVQGSVQAAQQFGREPGRSSADIIKMNQAALGKDVMDRPESMAPTSVREAEWYSKATPEQRANWVATKKAGHAPAANINNFPGGLDTVVIDGVPTRVQVGKDNKVVPIGPAAPTGDPMKQIVADMIRQRQKGAAAPTAAAPVQGQAPAAPPANQRRPGAIYNTPKGPLKWSGTGWTTP